MALALRDQQRHTYGDYCSWPEDVRYELIDAGQMEPVVHEVPPELIPPRTIDYGPHGQIG